MKRKEYIYKPPKKGIVIIDEGSLNTSLLYIIFEKDKYTNLYHIKSVLKGTNDNYTEELFPLPVMEELINLKLTNDNIIEFKNLAEDYFNNEIMK